MQALALQQEIQGTTKPDATLVTLADTQTEHYLHEQLEKIHPEALVFGEETWEQKGMEDIGDHVKKDVFFLDPIDGTSNFAAGLTTWGVSLGFASGGQLVHGAVFLPGTGELYITTDVHAAYMRTPLDRFGVPIVPPDNQGLIDFAAQRLAPLEVRPEQPVKLVSVTQYIAKGLPFKVPYTVISTGSFVVSMLNTARGSYSAYMAKAKIWDMAGAWPIARQAGVQARLVPSGKAFDEPLNSGVWQWNTDDPDFLGLSEHVLFYWDEIVAHTCKEAAKNW